MQTIQLVNIHLNFPTTILEKIKKISRTKLKKSYRCNHIAVIFKGNKIYSIGCNSHKTHPQILDYEYHDHAKIHAELSACIKFGKQDCKKFSIAVLRIDRNGYFNQSKPCVGCQSVIKQLGFRRVFFTNEFGEWEKF